MNTYAVFTIFHVVFTITALMSGLVAIMAEPKGGVLHKQAGRFYYFSYLALIIFAFLMLSLKFKLFFLALNFFGGYLVIAGNYYAHTKAKTVARNWWILSVLLVSVLLYMTDSIFVFYHLSSIGLDWVIVRLLFSSIALSVLVFELYGARNRIVLHAACMLLSFIPLINGLFARIAPSEYVWLAWIGGYIIFIPLMIIWFTKSPKMQALLKEN